MTVMMEFKLKDWLEGDVEVADARSIVCSPRALLVDVLKVYSQP